MSAALQGRTLRFATFVPFPSVGMPQNVHLIYCSSGYGYILPIMSQELVLSTEYRMSSQWDTNQHVPVLEKRGCSSGKIQAISVDTMSAKTRMLRRLWRRRFWKTRLYITPGQLFLVRPLLWDHSAAR